MLDTLEEQLKDARRERDELKADYRNVLAENERLKIRLDAKGSEYDGA